MGCILTPNSKAKEFHLGFTGLVFIKHEIIILALYYSYVWERLKRAKPEFTALVLCVYMLLPLYVKTGNDIMSQK